MIGTPLSGRDPTDGIPEYDKEEDRCRVVVTLTWFLTSPVPLTTVHHHPLDLVGPVHTLPTFTSHLNPLSPVYTNPFTKASSKPLERPFITPPTTETLFP